MHANTEIFRNFFPNTFVVDLPSCKEGFVFQFHEVWIWLKLRKIQL
jgi:hypothetical protein